MVNRFLLRTATLTSTVFIQAALLLVLAALLVFTFLFTPFPAVHDALHQLRHSLYIVACH